jgi:oxygen-independent coproporphyrinogen-3 oxidase
MKHRGVLLEALLKEIDQKRAYLDGKEVTTIYFGGGTPSLLNSNEIGAILDTIRSNFSVSREAEVTLEINPDDVVLNTPPVPSPFLHSTSPPTPLLKKRGEGVRWFYDFHEPGINRLSIGIQSFLNDDLEYLNRVHSSDQAINAVTEAQAAGFKNISIDLIFGIPTLTEEKWLKNIETAFSLGVQHISAYSLTVEPKTALDVLIRKKKVAEPMEENAVNHFITLMKRMKEEGFLHYEISNFCKKGFFSRHNSSYWSGEHYLGLGPSAHSFNGVSRQWNVSSITGYIDQINRREMFHETETLTTAQKYNEYIMTSLRTMWGCDVQYVREVWGEEIAFRFSLFAFRFIDKGWLVENNGVYCLTDDGKLFADGIAAEFFIE